MMETQDDRSNHTVEARAEPSACDEAAFELRRVEVDLFSRSPFLEGWKGFPTPNVFHRLAQTRVKKHPLVILHKIGSLQGRGNASFAQPRHLKMETIQRHRCSFCVKDPQAFLDAMYRKRSSTRFEYPHSLSYRETTLKNRFSPLRLF